jgi:hypothetical protein
MEGSCLRYQEGERQKLDETNEMTRLAGEKMLRLREEQLIFVFRKCEKKWSPERSGFLVFAGVFEGGFGKCGVSVWCFCGEVVVECMVKRGSLTDVFRW